MQKSENEREEAEAEGFDLETTLRPYKEMDWRILMALKGDPGARSFIAMAFRELTENAGKVGTLNISPDLLDRLFGEEDGK